MSVVFEDFSFTYVTGKEPSLRNIDFKIDKGEVALILGTAGAGKTSLLLSLNGFIPKEYAGYQEGDVIVDGLNTREHEVSELASHVVYTFEDPDSQLLGLTVEEDVAMGPQNLGCTVEQTLERVSWALDATRMTPFVKRTPDDLSGGEKQSEAIASALAMRPPIMALDEPVCMLDPLGKDRVLSILKSISKDLACTVVISEAGADIGDIIPIVDKIVLVENGQIIQVGPPRTVFQDPLFERMGICPDVTDLFLRLRKNKKDLPIPVTVEEAAEYLHQYVKRKIRIDRRGRPKKAEEGPKTKRNLLVKVRNLKHVYPGAEKGVEALKGVDLDIYEGEMLGFIGQNGSGKTTLALHLVGILKATNPDAELSVGGLDLTQKGITPRDVIPYANYVFQNPSDQIIEVTVEEEIAYGPRTIGLPEDEVRRRVEKELKLFGLEDYRKEYCESLTRGQRTCLAIASIFSLEPKLLVCDEPTTGLDYEGTVKMMDAIKKINEDGTTVIIITHNMRTIAEYTRRVVAMHQGRVIMDGPTVEVFSKPEELKKTWLRPAQMARLGQQLSDLGFPNDLLKLDDVYDLLREYV